jgi:hypothetical protein
MTNEQNKSLYRKWKKADQGMTFREFSESAVQWHNCIMVKWSGMWLGIETDGHTHS